MVPPLRARTTGTQQPVEKVIPACGRIFCSISASLKLEEEAPRLRFSSLISNRISRPRLESTFSTGCQGLPSGVASRSLNRSPSDAALPGESTTESNSRVPRVISIRRTSFEIATFEIACLEIGEFRSASFKVRSSDYSVIDGLFHSFLASLVGPPGGPSNAPDSRCLAGRLPRAHRPREVPMLRRQGRVEQAAVLPVPWSRRAHRSSVSALRRAAGRSVASPLSPLPWSSAAVLASRRGCGVLGGPSGSRVAPQVLRGPRRPRRARSVRRR